ncbi:hypothetical protein FHX82_001786 [Amycolatopsis bartoniae]|uniref:Uncharacterized protein n=1 Tax=Amycolatopsis bartoniae TaxID=941986 RepID=A0A8H9IVG7_9PSEU|nr:hypothetical protein [Amycolatopsis bartoniae]MBB2934766.1 hypothetical protein [Amycolatopsis bartoniae]TVS98906.1 hypothetical protein FNH07_36395 [Amycolatopsis bartoniae]GHF44909.1 hypothetical protein GCM10017566_17400 [Amycolatopsis bartoniae]
MRKLVVGILVGLGALVVTATPASASGWYYTGYWYSSSFYCEAGYQQLVGDQQVDLPHECRLDAVGVYELWRMSA